jgi:hypothetical protein
MREDLRAERSASVPFPPGETRFSLARTRRFADDPLGLLLDSYERFGPIFTLRIFHANVVFMLGPAANHYITVSHASNFTWRESHFRDLIGLMGDGLLTIDGDFHRRSRRIMLPAFHREHIAASADAVVQETERALDQLTPGASIDLYDWTRHLAVRVAMRALFGVDPDSQQARAIDAAALFEEALSFYATEYVTRILRGRFSPWARMQQAARKLDTLIYAEISRRRTTGERGHDILSLLPPRPSRSCSTSSPATPRSSPDCWRSRIPSSQTAAPPPHSSCPASSPNWRWCSRRRFASTRPRGSGRGARSSPSSSTGTLSPQERSSTTARGPPIV